jgi:hypothetical protein
MSISPVSASSATQAAQADQNQAQANKTAQQQQPDTVQLSPTAQAQLKAGGDSGGDGECK